MNIAKSFHLETLIESLNQYFGLMDGTKTLSDLILDNSVPEFVLDFLLVNDAVFKLNEGDFSCLFLYMPFLDIARYLVAIERVAPAISPYFINPTLFFFSVDKEVLIDFYEQGLSSNTHDQTYIRDKLDFLGKDYWRSKSSLSDDRNKYVDENMDKFIEFCDKHNLKYSLSEEELQDNIQSENAFISSLESRLSRKKLIENIFHIVDRKVIWDLSPTELAELKEVKMNFKGLGDEILVDFSVLQNLEFLQIVGGSLTSFPIGFGCLKSLKEIRLILSKVESIDNLASDLLNLPDLQDLDVSSNQIVEIPKFIGNIISLKSLKFKYNEKIKQIPDFVFDLPNLEVLQLIDNKIEVIPENISKLKNLRILSLGRNMIKEIPDEAYNLVIGLPHFT